MTVIVLAERSGEYLVFDTKDVERLRPDREKIVNKDVPGLDDVRDASFSLTMFFKDGTRPRWINKTNLPADAVLADHIVFQTLPFSGTS